jgi:hypothetical protein
MSKKILWGILFIITLLLLPAGCDSLSNIGDTPNATADGGITYSSNIGSIQKMTAVFGLTVWVKPINAKANVTYVVDLFEKGKFRESQSISWNAPQINVHESQAVRFNETKDEENAYTQASWNDSNWWKPIFSIKIREPIPTPTGKPSITLIYPNGGENWVIGEKVTIKWTSTNLQGKIVNMSMPFSYDSGNTWEYANTPRVFNTGTYDWTPKGKTSTHCRVKISADVVSEPDLKLSAISNADFTISAPIK